MNKSDIIEKIKKEAGRLREIGGGKTPIVTMGATAFTDLGLADVDLGCEVEIDHFCPIQRVYVTYKGARQIDKKWLMIVKEPVR